MDIKTICLAILAQANATGYEIQKTIKEGPLSYFFDASFGSIYPALARLTEEGLISCQVISEEGKPERKVYSINDNGRMTLSRALVKVPLHDRLRSPFLVSMLFSELLSSRELFRLLDQRLAIHESALENLGKMSSDGMSAGDKFVHGYAVAINEAARDYLDNHRAELEGELLMTSLAPELEETRS
jgi:DNA-binding PadR family transcriptional regulator